MSNRSGLVRRLITMRAKFQEIEAGDGERDAQHVEDHRNFWLDLQILSRTVRQVVTREGIAAPGAATMPEFRPQIPR